MLNTLTSAWRKPFCAIPCLVRINGRQVRTEKYGGSKASTRKETSRPLKGSSRPTPVRTYRPRQIAEHAIRALRDVEIQTKVIIDEQRRNPFNEANFELNLHETKAEPASRHYDYEAAGHGRLRHLAELRNHDQAHHAALFRMSCEIGKLKDARWSAASLREEAHQGQKHAYRRSERTRGETPR